MQRVPALGGVLLELGVRLLHHLLTLARELGAQPRHELPLLLDGGLQPVGVLADLCVGLGHQHLLSGLDALHVVGEALLQLADVARPVGEPLLDRQPERETSFSLSRSVASRSRSATSRRRSSAIRRSSSASCGQRVGAQPGEGVLELLGPLGELLRDDLVEGGLAALDLAFEQPLVRANLLQHDRARDQREHGNDRATTTATMVAAVTPSS